MRNIDDKLTIPSDTLKYDLSKSRITFTFTSPKKCNFFTIQDIVEMKELIECYPKKELLFKAEAGSPGYFCVGGSRDEAWIDKSTGDLIPQLIDFYKQVSGHEAGVIVNLNGKIANGATNLLFLNQNTTVAYNSSVINPDDEIIYFKTGNSL